MGSVSNKHKYHRTVWNMKKKGQLRSKRKPPKQFNLQQKYTVFKKPVQLKRPTKYLKPKTIKTFPKLKRPPHQRAPTKRTLTRPHKKTSNTKIPPTREILPKQKIQDKQFVVTGPRTSIFPFSLTPAAFLIPAIPTLVGKFT